MRLSIFRNRLLGSEFGYDNIVCISHCPSVMALASVLCPDIHIPKIDSASITKITFNGSKCQAEFVNKTDY